MKQIKTKKSNNNIKIVNALGLGLLIVLTIITFIYVFKANATLQLFKSTLIRIIVG